MSSRNLVWYMNVYRDGDWWVVIETGMPQDYVRIGVGRTLAEAYKEREDTPIRSVGRDCGLEDALEWAHEQALISSVHPDIEEDAVLTEEDL